MANGALKIEAPAGMQEEIGRLYAHLELARERTRAVMTGLSTEMLDARGGAREFSIANHLFHIAGIEFHFIHHVMRGDPKGDGAKSGFAAADLRSDAAFDLKGHDLGFYLGKLDEVRARTEAACWELKDEDLDTERDDPWVERRCTVRWIFAHLADHEAEHRGIIIDLKERRAARA